MSSVSSIASKVPRRRPVHKSSSGCERCRRRKIKCDERRPACSECKARNADCSARPRLRWSTKHEVFDNKHPPSKQSSAKSLARKRSGAVEGERMHSDDQCNASASDHWLSQPGGAVLLDPYVPISRHSVNANEQTSSMDVFIASELHEPSPQMAYTAGFVDVWSKELYRIIMNPGAEGLSYEDQGTLSDLSSSPASSLELPNLPTIEEASPATTIPEIPAESQWDEDKAYSEPSQPDEPIGDSPSWNVAAGAQSFDNSSPALYPEPAGSTLELVPFYFNVVCPILSTFDSEQNPFRAFVGKKWQDSFVIFCTIRSLAAAKLVWFMPAMRAHALEYRSLALTTLQKDISVATCWNVELLFTVLLLGVSSSWSDIADLGVVHLEAVQQAVLDDKVELSDDYDGFDAAGFFRNALIYWEMVSCAVNDTVACHDYANDGLRQQKEPRTPPRAARQRVYEAPARLVPHAWTGVASEPQVMFSQISRLIHRVRSSESASTTTGPSLDRPDDFLKAVRDLDEAIWSYSLPNLYDISNIRDPNTPAAHHLLLAEAYMFANLYQLYSVFPNVRRRRVRWIKNMTASSLREFDPTSWAGAQVSLWARILHQEDGMERWLHNLGHSVIIRLEQIQTSSGTSCVQALLLLVASTSLYLGTDAAEREEEEEAGTDANVEEQRQHKKAMMAEQEDILRTRRFVLERLEHLSRSNLSAPIQYVRNVVLEIFKRLDVGADVFWKDVLQSMGLVTIIG